MFSVRPVWIDVSLIWLSLVCLFVCSEGSFFKFGSGIFFFLASAVLLARPPFIASFFAFAHANCTHPFLCHAHDCSTIKGLPPRKCFSLIDSAPARTHTHTHTHTQTSYGFAPCMRSQVYNQHSHKQRQPTKPRTKVPQIRTQSTQSTQSTQNFGGGEGKSPKETQEKKVKQHRTTTNRTSQPPSSPSLSHTKKKKTNKTTRTHGCKQAKRATALATNGLWLICCSMQKH